ncbi:hypothetical protein [Kangiella sp. TOML190]|uniref:hypothetical protein n=1 Tax=Kangiella sp. TOML190 TaxID=2931351 RepID=UPI002040F0C0|nr:hypothetical protein [Kangiella sp. TOML190]
MKIKAITGISLLIIVTVFLLINKNETTQLPVRVEHDDVVETRTNFDYENSWKNSDVLASNLENKELEKSKGASLNPKDVEHVAEALLSDLYTDEEVSSSVGSVVDNFNKANTTTKSIQHTAEINNHIYEKGIYDVLLEKNVFFSNVECRDKICKLSFRVDEENGNIESRIPKMQLIGAQLGTMELLKGKKEVVTNDFQNRGMEYYFYSE